MRNNSVENWEKYIASNDEEAPKKSESSSDEKKEEKKKVVASISVKNTLPKESIKTQKATNTPHLISQSEPPASKEIMVDKHRTDLHIFPG